MKIFREKFNKMCVRPIEKIVSKMLDYTRAQGNFGVS